MRRASRWNAYGAPRRRRTARPPPARFDGLDAALEAGAASWHRYGVATTSSDPRTTITGLGVGQPLPPGTSYDVRVQVKSDYVDVPPGLTCERTAKTTGTAPREAPETARRTGSSRFARPGAGARFPRCFMIWHRTLSDWDC